MRRRAWWKERTRMVPPLTSVYTVSQCRSNASFFLLHSQKRPLRSRTMNLKPMMSSPVDLMLAPYTRTIALRMPKKPRNTRIQKPQRKQSRKQKKQKKRRMRRRRTRIATKMTTSPRRRVPLSRASSGLQVVVLTHAWAGV